MFKPFIAHYMNKYPGGSVDSDGSTYLRATDAKGKLRVSLVAGAGSMVDNSKMVGASDCHNLSPIPKDCRVFCDGVDGIHRHAHADQREKVAAKLAEMHEGRVPSVEELCGDEFQQSHKFVDEFRAEKWMGGEVAPVHPVKKAANKKK